MLLAAASSPSEGAALFSNVFAAAASFFGIIALLVGAITTVLSKKNAATITTLRDNNDALSEQNGLRKAEIDELRMTLVDEIKKRKDADAELVALRKIVSNVEAIDHMGAQITAAVEHSETTIQEAIRRMQESQDRYFDRVLEALDFHHSGGGG